jgi:hypothetical protein
MNHELLQFQQFCAYMRRARPEEPSAGFLLDEWNLMRDGHREWLSPESQAFLSGKAK